MGLKERNQILVFLKKSGISFEHLVHAPVFTSKQAAKVRGVSLKQDVKAMVLSSNSKELFLFCLSADRKIDFKKAARVAGVGRLFLASPADVFRVTGCEIGSVSPFSGTISNLKTFFDRQILENETIEFNIGLHTDSVRMKSADLLALIKPALADFGL